MNDRNSRSLPLWRAVPICMALVALLFIPGMKFGGQQNSVTSEPSLKVTPVNYQADVAPPIQLPDFSVDEAAGSLGGQSMDKELATANQVINAITPADWLGPLAPVAMSPFFGITCLSGLAIWSPDWMPFNSLLSSSTALKNPALFWAFAALTILTSLPRLSKLSKPLAQAIDQVEAYAGIITLFVIKYLATGAIDTSEGGEVLEAGVVSASLDGLLYIAMVINVLVINAVKFFFEFMIWLTPVPFIDACFEAANKAICGGLMAVYAFSPTLATVINVALFAICLLALRWISRRVKLYRTMAFDPLWSLISPSYGKPKSPTLVVFPDSDWQGFQDKACLTMQRTSGAYEFKCRRWIGTPTTASLSSDTKLTIRRGLLWNKLVVGGDEGVEMTFSKRYGNLEELAELLNADIDAEAQPEVATA